LILGRPPTGTGAPGTVPAPGLTTPPPGIGSAPGMGAPGVGGPTPIIETEPGYSPIKIEPPGIRPPTVSPTNATSLGSNSSIPPNQQYGTPAGYMRPSGPGPVGGYPTTQGSNTPSGVPPGSVPPPGGASYQQYPPSQHFPPVGSGTSASSSSLLPQPSRGVKRQMEE
jgi:hypothetical protein